MLKSAKYLLKYILSALTRELTTGTIQRFQCPQTLTLCDGCGLTSAEDKHEPVLMMGRVNLTVLPLPQCQESLQAIAGLDHFAARYLTQVRHPVDRLMHLGSDQKWFAEWVVHREPQALLHQDHSAIHAHWSPVPLRPPPPPKEQAGAAAVE